MDISKKTFEICKLYEIEPRRSKGQNFLISEKIYDKIVKFAELEKDDTVMEVGPGLGFLTAKLASQAKEVIAVELDDKLAGFLKDAINSQNVDNVKVINQNVLDLDLSSILSSPKAKFKIVANLPYNITSVFLRRFISENQIKPELMVLMLQKEVAQRICAGPGEMSLLACSVQLYADCEVALDVPASKFWPQPKVDSAIIKLRTKNEELRIDEKQFFQMLKFGFAAKRKMLRNNLSAGYRIKPAEADEKLNAAGIKSTLRPQDLSVDDWLKVYEQFKK
ncbi:ribosomal RNA small subunit methyltransferase A [Candidatus Falkowbacteria bacterium]|nr:ribosomal RNA small subunit methyltransferase A [Candidatus Falkowbacteria bacterium]